MTEVVGIIQIGGGKESTPGVVANGRFIGVNEKDSVLISMCP